MFGVLVQEMVSAPNSEHAPPVPEEGAQLVALKNPAYSVSEADPSQPTTARPGSEEKVRTLAARYASGLPLWHPQDNDEHGPPEEQREGTEGTTVSALDGRPTGNGDMDTKVPPEEPEGDGHRIHEILNQGPRELPEGADPETAVVSSVERRREMD